MTFSIAARCAQTGMFGLALTSSSPAVAARCAYARAGVGAAASQNITDPSLGPRALDLMAAGASATEALAAITKNTAHIEFRQLTAIDATGRSAHFSGSRTLGTYAVSQVENAVAAGNILANSQVPDAMTAAFTKAAGHLGDRLLAAMLAGLAAGGEVGPIHSAGMVLVDKVAWPVTDLRVDWHETDPLGKLARLWALWQPQADDYLTRAVDPASSPRYRVAGDL